MATPQVPPSITEQTFCCPHCGAYTTQYWFSVAAKQREDKNGAPGAHTQADADLFANDDTIPADTKARIVPWLERLATGEIFFDDKYKDFWSLAINNLNLSKCFACKKIAIWVHDTPIYPPQRTGPAPNPDLPQDVLKDYEEAQGVVALSPRGAAALLRLAIQKLCKVLGVSGENIDADIAAMVKKGLNPLVQQSLDIVRVIGNESVHPGVLDMRDNTDTATKLFGLVNLIAEQMISNPKHVQAMYNSLPQAKRDGIANRDNPKK